MAPFDEVGVLTFRVALTVGPELQIGQQFSPRCEPRVQELREAKRYCTDPNMLCRASNMICSGGKGDASENFA